MIDARGLSCPIPVLMTQKVMKDKADYYEVLVDSATPCENVRRFAESQGYNVEIENINGEFRLKITR